MSFFPKIALSTPSALSRKVLPNVNKTKICKKGKSLKLVFQLKFNIFAFKQALHIMKETENIIITHSLDNVGNEAFSDYLSHALCLGGQCTFLFNGKEFNLSEGDLMIVRKGKLVEKIRPDADFKVINIMVTSEFIIASSPVQNNYGTKGQLALFLNPVMHLTHEQYNICRHDFNNIAIRLSQTGHHFRHELLMNAVQTMILDFFDFHSHLHKGDADVSVQFAGIMNSFLSLLENGEYRQHREVAWYADKLCITPKYLSQVSKEVSGYAANFWINRYTILDISRLLRDKSLTFVSISDIFGFSSPAYFCRYVQRYLGTNPSDYRGQ